MEEIKAEEVIRNLSVALRMLQARVSGPTVVAPIQIGALIQQALDQASEAQLLCANYIMQRNNRLKRDA